MGHDFCGQAVAAAAPLLTPQFKCDLYFVRMLIQPRRLLCRGGHLEGGWSLQIHSEQVALEVGLPRFKRVLEPDGSKVIVVTAESVDVARAGAVSDGDP
jgi:hypothetical protein